MSSRNLECRQRRPRWQGCDFKCGAPEPRSTTAESPAAVERGGGGDADQRKAEEGEVGEEDLGCVVYRGSVYYVCAAVEGEVVGCCCGGGCEEEKGKEGLQDKS